MMFWKGLGIGTICAYMISALIIGFNSIITIDDKLVLNFILYLLPSFFGAIIFFKISKIRPYLGGFFVGLIFAIGVFIFFIPGSGDCRDAECGFATLLGLFGGLTSIIMGILGGTLANLLIKNNK